MNVIDSLFYKKEELYPFIWGVDNLDYYDRVDTIVKLADDCLALHHLVNILYMKLDIARDDIKSLKYKRKENKP